MALSPLGIALMMQPPAAQARPGQVNPTDVLGAYNLSANMAEQQYQAKLAQQNALWGGLAGLGAAGIIASPKLFGSGGPLAGLFSKAAAPTADAAGTATNTAAASGMPSWFTGAQLSAPPAAAADWTLPSSIDTVGLAPYTTGASSALDAGTGSVAADMAAASPAIDAGTAVGADASGMALADVLPFLFA